MRVLPVLLLAAGCATWRDVGAPAPYGVSGYRIEIQPRVTSSFGFQQIRGAVRNETEEAADVMIVLYLFDGEARVGQAIGHVVNLRPREIQLFEASVLPWAVPDPEAAGGDFRRYRPLPFGRVDAGHVLATPRRDEGA